MILTIKLHTHTQNVEILFLTLIFINFLDVKMMNYPRANL